MASTDNVSLRQLRYFLAAAETGQFSMAATRTHVSQSAITNAVLLLEASLGVRLFDRRPHGVTLTADGQRFYHRTRDILDSLDDCLREPQLPAVELKGSIRIGASYTLLGYFLPPLLARFRNQFPEVTLDLRDMPRPQIEAGIADGSLDVGVVILSNIAARERFGHHVLVRSRRQLWTSADHPLLKKHNAALADIAAYPYIQATVDESEESTRRYWESRQLEPQVAFRTGSMEALRGLIAHGFGVSILSDMVYRHWSLEGKRIEARPVLDLVPDMEVGLLWHPDNPLERPASAFRQFLIQSCGL
jgi:DNA-binding transcriptional LysR family regulator